MAQSLSEIPSDKKRNAHFLQRMHERERIFRIGAGMGPEHRDLKREGFGKLLDQVGMPVNDVEQRHLCGPQRRRGLGGKFPNRRPRAQTQRQKCGCYKMLQLRAPKTGLCRMRGEGGEAARSSGLRNNRSISWARSRALI